ncbi:MAG: S1/P1 nuclease [Candidatus Bipolaricaulia bacterium]
MKERKLEMHNWPTRSLILLGLLLGLVLGTTYTSFAWGLEGHQIINAWALENLPEPLRSYFLEHRDFILANACAADERKSVDPDESPKHYIDLDYYDRYPFAKVSHDLDELIAQYGELTVKQQGLLPWAIADTVEKLAAQMKAGDAGLWLTAADLAHYIGDAHQPLHTTKDYDGRDFRTRGIHARFEETLVLFFWEEGYFQPFEAQYIDDPLETAFTIVVESYRGVERLFQADIEAQKVGSKHSLDKEGYWRAFWDNGAGETMIDRLNKAAFYVASFWYTAWVEAGKPELVPVKAEVEIGIEAEGESRKAYQTVVLALAMVLTLILAVIILKVLK